MSTPIDASMDFIERQMGQRTTADSKRMNHRMRMVVTIRPAVPDIYAPYLTSRGVIVKSEEAEV